MSITAPRESIAPHESSTFRVVVSGQIEKRFQKFNLYLFSCVNVYLSFHVSKLLSSLSTCLSLYTINFKFTVYRIENKNLKFFISFFTPVEKKKVSIHTITNIVCVQRVAAELLSERTVSRSNWYRFPAQHLDCLP